MIDIQNWCSTKIYSIYVFKCFESTFSGPHIRNSSISSKSTNYGNNSKERLRLILSAAVFIIRHLTNRSFSSVSRYNRFSSTLEQLSICVLVLIESWYLWYLSFRLLFRFFFLLNLVPNFLQLINFCECFSNRTLRLYQIARFLSSKSLNQTKLFLSPFLWSSTNTAKTASRQHKSLEQQLILWVFHGMQLLLFLLLHLFISESPCVQVLLK